jgi:outer membrane protein OmpA-like peptidoglycan-associated protein
VVVTLRDAFKGAALTPDADTKLKELGRVLAAHPGHAAQIVVHDATTPTPAEAAVASQRAEAAAKTLGAAANAPDKVKAEVAGARAPIVDPTDAKNRGRNARLDVVFVTPGN